MKSILLAHAAKYPMMEPTDAVKLLYQSEFGGGHLIQDANLCLDYLLREYTSTPQISGFPLTEEIGNGFVRINLAALDQNSLSVEELGSAFFLSASQHHGSMDSFRNKLALLIELTQAGMMPFSPDALDTYLADYEKSGFPAVSHSEHYRNAYHPAYRVVSKVHLPRQVC